MRKNLYLLLYTIIFCGFSSCSNQQPEDLTGSWLGILPIELTGQNLKLIFDIKKTDSCYYAQMHDPDNMSLYIPVTIQVDDSIRIQEKKTDIKFIGKYKKNNIIEGVYTQMGYSQNIQFVRQEKPVTFNRPQSEKRDKKNFYNESVYITNPEAKDVELSAYFCRPLNKLNFPVAILIAGSGAIDRDGAVAGHKPFEVITDYLVKKGIAVLRYDKRGVRSSFGNYSQATSEDFASDVEAIIDYLKTREEVDKQKIGLIGHSEGGLISFMLGAKRKDISYIVSMGGPGISGEELYDTQSADFARLANFPDSVVKNNKKIAQQVEEISSSISYDSIAKNINYFVDLVMAKNSSPDSLVARYNIGNALITYALPWTKFMKNYDPTENLKKSPALYLP